MIAKNIFSRALEKYREEGLVTLLNSSQSYVYRRTQKYFDKEYLCKRTRRYFEKNIIAKQILWGSTQFYNYTYWRHKIHQRRFVAPADPFRTITVNPLMIETYNPEIGKEWGLGRVIGGDWDRDTYCKPISNNSIFTGLKQRFVEGLEWKETDYYKMAQRDFKNLGSIWGYMDLDQFLEIRCGYVDDLYESIRQHGYRPNRNGQHNVPIADTHRKEKVYIHELEPLVVIGREGVIYWRDGNHRTAIAQILGMEELPVQVLCRHRNWQLFRDELARAPKKQQYDQIDQKALKDHPDLQEII